MSSGIVETRENKESEKTSGAPSPNANRSQLVQRLLNLSVDLPAFVQDLLTTQAVTVAGTEAAGFLIERAPEGFGLRLISHIRPDNSGAEQRAAAVAAFQELIKPCIAQNRDGAIEIAAPADGGEAQFCLVTLLRSEGDVVAVSAVITRCINTERARQRLMSMQLVAGYFELYTLRKNSDQAKLVAQSHQHVLQLATSVATAEGFESAGMNLCNELATRSGATRVSLGWLKGRRIKIKALSHTEEFDKKQELIVALQNVMEECLDQEDVVQFDPNGRGTDNVTRSAQQLSRSQGGHIVLSLPLRRRADIIGVVTLEFLPNQKITSQVAHGLGVAVDLLAPQLYDRYQNDRYLVTKAGISTRESAKMVIGPKHMLGKLIALLVIAAIVAVIVIKPMYHVTAQFRFVPVKRFVLSAPDEGVIGALTKVNDPALGLRPLKPGDKVQKDQVLLTMDTTELRAKRDDALARKATYEAQANSYRQEAARPGLKRDASNSMAQALIAQDQANQAQAEVNLYEVKIAQATIRSPIDGVILAGDLDSQQFNKVEKGKELFEIGQPDHLEAEVAVPERDIQDIKVGSVGKLATHSLPDEKHALAITRIEPSVDPKEGDNFFKVYASADPKNTDGSKTGTWLPGMEGEASIDVAHKPLWWIASHRLIDFLKLKVWQQI